MLDMCQPRQALIWDEAMPMYNMRERPVLTMILSSIAAFALPVRTVANALVVLSRLFSILVICISAVNDSGSTGFARAV